MVCLAHKNSSVLVFVPGVDIVWIKKLGMVGIPICVIVIRRDNRGPGSVG